MADQRCRLCLAIVQDSDCSILEKTFRQAIRRVFTFELPAAEGLPTSVCRECSTYVWDFHLYSRMVGSNQNALVKELSTKQQEDEGNYTEEVQDVVDGIDMGTATEGEEQDTCSINEPELVDEVDMEEKGITQTNDSDVEEVVTTGENVAIALDTDDESVDEESNAPRKAYRCDRCRESFKLKRDLKHHTETHHTAIPFPCDQCEKSFRTKLQLHDHKRLHKREQCPVCGKSIVSRLMKRHIAAHDGAFRCDVCGQCVSTPQMLRLHKQDRHPPEGATKTHTCAQCGRAFFTEQLLRMHRQTHRKVVCKICNKAILKRHQKSHLASHRGAFRCTECGLELSSRNALRKHADLKHAPTTELSPEDCATCGQCGESFHNATQLQYHHNQYHAVRECPFCKTTVKASAYYRHIRIHNPTSFPCDLCDSILSTKNHLRRHKTKLHPDGKQKPVRYLPKENVLQSHTANDTSVLDSGIGKSCV